jgi:hypothetical protein
MTNTDPTLLQETCKHPNMMYRGLEYAMLDDAKFNFNYYYFDVYYCIKCLAIVAVTRDTHLYNINTPIYGSTNNQALVNLIAKKS